MALFHDETISYLDPLGEPYLMGGTMLSVCEQYDLSDKVFEKGHKHLPNEPYFPLQSHLLPH